MAIVSMTTVDGYDLNINSDTILLVVEETTSRKLFWDDKGIDADVNSVTATFADLLADVGPAPLNGAGNLIQVTISGEDVLLNANRVAAISAYGSGSKLFYSGKGRAYTEYITDEDPATIEAAIDAL